MITDKIYDLGLLPVIKIEDAADAKPLAKALIEGDMPAAEITFRTSAAKDSIKAITSEFPDMLVGAGTVLSISQVDDALEAGAKFIISPGLNPKVVEYCVDKGISVYPGVNNPTHIEQAMELGLSVVKFFPAENSGGLDMLKAMSAPYTRMKFMPTGGINVQNIVKYLNFNKIIACGGSWMVPDRALKEKDFAGITKLAAEAVSTVVGFKPESFGTDGEKELLSAIFGESYESGGSFVSFSVNNMRRALAFLKRKGVAVSKMEKSSEGEVVEVFLNIETESFKVRLTQR